MQPAAVRSSPAPSAGSSAGCRDGVTPPPQGRCPHKKVIFWWVASARGEQEMARRRALLPAAGAGGEEGAWWLREEEQGNLRKGTRLCLFSGGELLDQPSHLMSDCNS